MGALYMKCPHCGFPAIVREPERAFSRRCRQCWESYRPTEPKAGGGRRTGSSRIGRRMMRGSAMWPPTRSAWPHHD